MTDTVPAPVRRFIADMAAAGAPVTVDGPRLMYEVTAVAGPYAASPVPTGVSASEVGNWPLVPPHWMHLQAEVMFPPGETNMDAGDARPGWLRHSRDLGAWDMTVPPALAWLRHVRGVVSAAAWPVTV